ncbi:hypothetical protein Csa_022163 [Cucumis sativus]|nr:hypothetical protein Csa_022163 [Cucumis sativus]
MGVQNSEPESLLQSSGLPRLGFGKLENLKGNGREFEEPIIKTEGTPSVERISSAWVLNKINLD